MLLEATGYVKADKICELARMEKQTGKTNSNTSIHYSSVDEHSFLYHKSHYIATESSTTILMKECLLNLLCYTVTMNYELTGMENEVGIPTNIPVQHTPNIKKTKTYWGQQNLSKIYTVGRVKCWQIKWRLWGVGTVPNFELVSYVKYIKTNL